MSGYHSKNLFKNSSSQLFTLLESLGIGTNSADSSVHAKTTSAACSIRAECTDADSLCMFILKNDAQSWQLMLDGAQLDRFVLKDVTGGGLYPFQVKAAAANETLIVSTGGQVGINDTTPSYALDVTGDIRATGNFRSADGSQGATGSGNNVTVKNGIVTAVS